jgi:hypothetical protein
MFRTVSVSIIRSLALYTQQWCMSYRLCWPLASKKLIYPVWHIAIAVCTPDDGQRNSPKHVEFYSKNKFEKLVHLVGFIIRIFYVPFEWGYRHTQMSVGKYRCMCYSVCEMMWLCPRQVVGGCLYLGWSPGCWVAVFKGRDLSGVAKPRGLPRGHSIPH